jgi:hypothetical protein
MTEVWIWVHTPDARINGQTGFVVCDSAIAEKLLAEGKAQDPRVGAHHLKEITHGQVETRQETAEEVLTSDVGEYDTKVMTPKRGRPRKVEA